MDYKMKSTAYLPKKVRTLVWVLSALVIALIGFSSGTASNLAAPQELYAAPTQVLRAPGDVNSNPEANSAINARYGTDAIELLPAYRWDNLNIDVVAETGYADGISNGIDSLVANITSLMFKTQAFLWGFLVDILAWALNFDLLTAGPGERINEVFVQTSNAIVSSGLILVPLILAMIAIATAVFKNNTSSIFRIALAAIIPVGFLFALTTGAEQDRNGDTISAAEEDADLNSQGLKGPLWLASTANNAIEGVTANALSVLEITDNSYGALTPPEGILNSQHSCATYTGVLYSKYRELSAADTAPAFSVSVAVPGGGTTQIDPGAMMVERVSSLWERASLQNWRQAQFSDTISGWQIYCHLLETQSGIGRAEQTTLGVLANYPSIDTDNTSYWLEASDIHDKVDADLIAANAEAAQNVVVSPNGDLVQSEEVNLSNVELLFEGDAMTLTTTGLPKNVPSTNIPSEFAEVGGRRDPYGAGDRDGKGKQANLLMATLLDCEART